MYFGHEPGSFNRVWMSVIWDGVSAGDDHLRCLLQIASEGWEGTQRGYSRHKYKSKVTHSHSQLSGANKMRGLSVQTNTGPSGVWHQTLEAVTEIWAAAVRRVETHVLWRELRRCCCHSEKCCQGCSWTQWLTPVMQSSGPHTLTCSLAYEFKIYIA